MYSGAAPVSVDFALQCVLQQVGPLQEEVVAASDSHGRVVAVNVIAGRDLPGWDGSAMDGYAVRSRDLELASSSQPVALPIRGRIAAGDPVPPALPPSSCARVLTGAMLPTGADAVVKQEEIEIADGQIAFRRAVRTDEHVRRRGEDIRQGQIVLRDGQVVGPGEIAVLAALGRSVLAVRRRPVVTVIATGRELKQPDEQLAPGKLVDSNSWGLRSMALEAGADVRLTPAPSDDVAVLARAVEQAVGTGDLIVTTGGVSAGDFDVTKEALADLGGQILVSGIAMRPGKPMTFGLVHGCPIFALPGNPVAAMTAFELFVRPAILAAGGHHRTGRPVIEARLRSEQRNSRAVPHYLRGRIVPATGGYDLRLVPKQGAATLSSMLDINAIAMFREDRRVFGEGSLIPCLLLTSAV